MSQTISPEREKELKTFLKKISKRFKVPIPTLLFIDESFQTSSSFDPKFETIRLRKDIDRHVDEEILIHEFCHYLVYKKHKKYRERTHGKKWIEYMQQFNELRKNYQKGEKIWYIDTMGRCQIGTIIKIKKKYHTILTQFRTEFDCIPHLLLKIKD